MPASEKVREVFSSHITDKERERSQKLIEDEIMGSTEHGSFEYADEYEREVASHDGDRNWAVREFAKKKGWIE